MEIVAKRPIMPMTTIISTKEKPLDNFLIDLICKSIYWSNDSHHDKADNETNDDKYDWFEHGGQVARHGICLFFKNDTDSDKDLG